MLALLLPLLLLLLQLQTVSSNTLTEPHLQCCQPPLTLREGQNDRRAVHQALPLVHVTRVVEHAHNVQLSWPGNDAHHALTVALRCNGACSSTCCRRLATFSYWPKLALMGLQVLICVEWMSACIPFRSWSSSQPAYSWLLHCNTCLTQQQPASQPLLLLPLLLLLLHI
jgi:hypothetical protein